MVSVADKPILVVGATGSLGGEICRRLADAGRPVRAFVRATSNPAKRLLLQRAGVEQVEGDLKDRASLARACRGVAAVISTAATTVSRQPDDSITATDLEGQKSLVDAARAAGVERFVYISVEGAVPEQGPFMSAKRAVERRLRQSGLTFTILRPSGFMEMWLGPFVGFDIAHARVYGTGEGKINWISFRDVAAFAIEALDNPAACDAVIELGNDLLSQMDVVRMCETLSGRRFTVEHVPVEAILNQMTACANEHEQAMCGLMLYIANGEPPLDMRETLRTFPVQLTSMREYTLRMLQS